MASAQERRDVSPGPGKVGVRVGTGCHLGAAGAHRLLCRAACDAFACAGPCAVHVAARDLERGEKVAMESVCAIAPWLGIRLVEFVQTPVCV